VRALSLRVEYEGITSIPSEIQERIRPIYSAIISAIVNRFPNRGYIARDRSGRFQREHAKTVERLEGQSHGGSTL
jgi:hypothetical protein